MTDCEQRNGEKSQSQVRFLDWVDNAATRFGCYLLRSVSDKVRQRLFSGVAVQQVAEEMTLPLWS